MRRLVPEAWADARATCAYVAAKLAVDEVAVLPFSTGVIGEFLDLTVMRRGIDAAVDAARPGGWADAARAIMTTDTAPKAVSGTGNVDGIAIRATGMVKGSGMIRPDMATMLAFLGTDASVSAPVAAALARDSGRTQLQSRHDRRRHLHKRLVRHHGQRPSRR